MIPKTYFDPEEPGVLRILSDQEWRGIGITQSLGWEHYEVHGECGRDKRNVVAAAIDGEERQTDLGPLVLSDLSAPEPHILLFRREKDFQEKVRRDATGKSLLTYADINLMRTPQYNAQQQAAKAK